jgi:excinuclease ABC subunit B
MLYERNDIGFTRGKFRVRGDVVEVQPANLDEEAIRIEFFGDEVDRITRFEPLTGPHDRLADDVHALSGEAVRHAAG